MLSLPEFPWDQLAEAKQRASTHPDGWVDLSVGSPVDPTPPVIAEALASASDAHSYPTTVGSEALRAAIAGWYHRRRGLDLGLDEVLPTVGSKEFIALAPLLLGLGPGDVVVHPTVAYPTYAIGALTVGATPLAADDPEQWPAATKLVWLNSPSNPTGAVADVETLRRAVAKARELGAVIASDECYAEFSWTTPDITPGVLDDAVSDGDYSSLLSVSSLSKQSNLAGYRGGYLAGDRALISGLVQVRKHLGLMVPGPIQAAMTAALTDDEHVRDQRDRYRARRSRLAPALERAGLRIDDSEAGLYLWATRGEDCWQTVSMLAGAGILVAPGAFYGPAGAEHVRVALTASDADISEAVARLDLF